MVSAVYTLIKIGQKSMSDHPLKKKKSIHDKKKYKLEHSDKKKYL